MALKEPFSFWTHVIISSCNRMLQIVGTNGKGNISAMLSNALIKNKYDVGLYTSHWLI